MNDIRKEDMCKKCNYYPMCWKIKEKESGNPMYQDITMCSKFNCSNNNATIEVIEVLEDISLALTNIHRTIALKG